MAPLQVSAETLPEYLPAHVRWERLNRKNHLGIVVFDPVAGLVAEFMPHAGSTRWQVDVWANLTVPIAAVEDGEDPSLALLSLEVLYGTAGPASTATVDTANPEMTTRLTAMYHRAPDEQWLLGHATALLLVEAALGVPQALAVRWLMDRVPGLQVTSTPRARESQRLVWNLTGTWDEAAVTFHARGDCAILIREPAVRGTMETTENQASVSGFRAPGEQEMYSYVKAFKACTDLLAAQFAPFAGLHMR